MDIIRDSQPHDQYIGWNGHSLPQILINRARITIILQRTGLIAESLSLVLISRGFYVQTQDYNDIDFNAISSDLVIFIKEAIDIPTRLLSLQVEKSIPVIVVVDESNIKLAHDLIAEGVGGILTTNDSINVFVGTVNLACIGCDIIPGQIMKTRHEETGRSEGAPVSVVHGVSKSVSFTCREHDVIMKLQKGLQNKIIAYELGISENTVKVHLHNIMKKLHTRNRTQVIVRLNADNL